jgi:hypothetical protein
VAGGAKVNNDIFISRIFKALDIHEKYAVLSDWDTGFCESLMNQIERKRSLSTKQIAILEKVESKCTPSAIEEALNWATEYKEKYRDDALICATYYRSANYFSALATRILEEPTFVPSRNSHKKMCENKYAQKVLAIAKADPVYVVGSDVEFRSPALGYRRKHLAGTPCLVIEVMKHVYNHARGSKQYKILPYGEIEAILVEERQIKKCRYKRVKAKADEIPF